MIRLLGGAVGIASSLAAYLCYTYTERKRLEVLEDAISLIKHIRDKVDCYSAPIDKIISTADPSVFSRLSVDKEERNLGVVIFGFCRELDGECNKILTAFADSFGKSYRSGQILLCDEAIRELELCRNKMRDSYQSRKRVAATLAAVASGMILIFML